MTVPLLALLLAASSAPTAPSDAGGRPLPAAPEAIARAGVEGLTVRDASGRERVRPWDTVPLAEQSRLTLLPDLAADAAAARRARLRADRGDFLWTLEAVGQISTPALHARGPTAERTAVLWWQAALLANDAAQAAAAAAVSDAVGAPDEVQPSMIDVLRAATPPVFLLAADAIAYTASAERAASDASDFDDAAMCAARLALGDAATAPAGPGLPSQIASFLLDPAVEPEAADAFARRERRAWARLWWRFAGAAKLAHGDAGGQRRAVLALLSIAWDEQDPASPAALRALRDAAGLCDALNDTAAAETIRAEHDARRAAADRPEDSPG